MKQEFISGLEKLGVKPTDTILMHSSLSSLGYVEGGADTVIDILTGYLSQGTLLIPSLSYVLVNEPDPLFSVTDTPSCVGQISETFRKREGVMRSIHPTHSVCGTGRYAKEILSRHFNTNTPASPEFSPFGLLPQYRGKILMLGCGLRPNTSMHSVEETICPWYLLKKEPVLFRIRLENGDILEKPYRCHNFGGSRAVQRYDRVADIMDIRQGQILQAPCYLIDAAVMWEKAREMLAKDVNYFIDIQREEV